MNEKLIRLLEQYQRRPRASVGWRKACLRTFRSIPFSHKFQRRMDKLLRRQRRSPGRAGGTDLC